MAYNFCAIQRKSDGKYLQTNGAFGTLDFSNNYTRARFYYGDPDDVSNYVSGYGGGDYRILEYWMPGDSGRNKPFSDETVIGNFLGSPGGANKVKIASWSRSDFFSIDTSDPATATFNTDAQNALNNRKVVILGFNGDQYAAAGYPEALPPSEFTERGIFDTLPDDLAYGEIVGFGGRNYYFWTDVGGDLSGQSIQYFIQA